TPIEAIRFCLRSRGISLADVDRIAIYRSEAELNELLRKLFVSPLVAGDGGKALMGLRYPEAVDGRGFYHRLLSSELGPFDGERIHFVKHHVAHAASAYHQSGFERPLVVTLDGFGDDESGTVSLVTNGRLEQVRSMSVRNSLGQLYERICFFLG